MLINLIYLEGWIQLLKKKKKSPNKNTCLKYKVWKLSFEVYMSLWWVS